jgi:galactokinase/mevalonate kinase-like predicted kinase
MIWRRSTPLRIGLVIGGTDQMTLSLNNQLIKPCKE